MVCDAGSFESAGFSRALRKLKRGQPIWNIHSKTHLWPRLSLCISPTATAQIADWAKRNQQVVTQTFLTMLNVSSLKSQLFLLSLYRRCWLSNPATCNPHQDSTSSQTLLLTAGLGLTLHGPYFRNHAQEKRNIHGRNSWSQLTEKSKEMWIIHSRRQAQDIQKGIA